MKLTAELKSRGMSLHWPIVRMLHRREMTDYVLMTWQPRVEDELIETTWPLRFLTDEEMVLWVRVEDCEGMKFEGEMKIFSQRYQTRIRWQLFLSFSGP